MPRLNNQDVKRYRDYIRIARKMETDRKSVWDAVTDYYKGKQKIRVEKPIDFIVVNEILPMVESKVAAVAANPPVWRFTPHQPGGEGRALLWPVLMAGIWDRIQAQPQARQCARDRRIFGYCIAKVGYRFETSQELFVDVSPEQAEKLRAGESLPSVPFASPELIEMQGRFVARNPAARILHDDLSVERVSPRRFFPDPEIDWANIQKAEWILHQIVRPLEEVKKTKRYSGTRDLQGDRAYQPEDAGRAKPYSPENVPEAYARVTLSVIYHRRDDLVVTFAQEKDEPLDVEEFPYNFEGYPFEVSSAYEPPDDLWPIGDVQIAMPVQDEKNLVRSRAATRIRRLVDKYAIDKAGITDGTLEAIESDQEGAIVKLDTPPTAQTLQLVGSRGYPSDLLAHERNVDRDFSNITGQPEYARSTTPAGVETATEASILREMAGVRSADDQAQFDDFLARIGKKLKSLAEQFYDVPRTMSLPEDVARRIEDVGDQSVQMESSPQGAWMQYDRESIKVDGELTVEAGSTAFRNRILEQERTSKQFTPLWNNPLVDQERLTRLYITRATDFGREADQLVIPKAQIAQAQMQLQGQPGAGNGGEPATAPQGTDESVVRSLAQAAVPPGGV